MGDLRRCSAMQVALTLGFLALSASAVAAQIPNGSVVTDPAYMAQQQMDRQQAIELENRLNTLDARTKSEKHLRDFEATLPPPAFAAPQSAASVKKEDYAAIPDDALAASNERVRAVSKKPR